jgi:hypothetical protein
MSKLLMVGMATRPETPDAGKVLLYAKGKRLYALDEDGKEFNLNQDGWGLQFMIGNYLQAIGVGYKGFVQVPYDCYIDKVSLAGDITGSNTRVDIWKSSTYPPTAAGSIVGGILIPYTGMAYYEDTALVGWSTGINEGEFLGFYVTGSSSTTMLIVSLSGRKL